jgi:hypothetical protein
MAKNCMILTPPAADMEALGKMADVAVAAGPSTSYWPYYQFVKALAEFRQGHFREASDWAQKVVAAGGEETRMVEAYAVMAMAQYQQKQLDEARVTLESGNSLAEERFAKPGINWHDRIIAQLLLREAGQLIQPGETQPEGTR